MRRQEKFFRAYVFTLKVLLDHLLGGAGPSQIFLRSARSQVAEETIPRWAGRDFPPLRLPFVMLPLDVQHFLLLPVSSGRSIAGHGTRRLFLTCLGRIPFF